MGITIPGKTIFLIETAPRSLYWNSPHVFVLSGLSLPGLPKTLYRLPQFPASHKTNPHACEGLQLPVLSTSVHPEIQHGTASATSPSRCFLLVPGLLQGIRFPTWPGLTLDAHRPWWKHDGKLDWHGCGEHIGLTHWPLGNVPVIFNV